jgi:hypothetical protein
VRIERALAAVQVIAPHILDGLVAAEGLTGEAGQIEEQISLLARNALRFAVHRQAEIAAAGQNAADSNELRSFGFIAPSQRFDAQKQIVPPSSRLPFLAMAGLGPRFARPQAGEQLSRPSQG